jgi:hypothetical protein
MVSFLAQAGWTVTGMMAPHYHAQLFSFEIESQNFLSRLVPYWNLPDLILPHSKLPTPHPA